ncbi:MAG TPA: LegC family aminotransferase [Cytophagaceae bacterium]|jgi:perosamine synthetase|nr:LegC family aminotransferase [Cytophagaceae bacterium]
MFKEVVDFIREINHGRANIPLHEPKFAGNEKKYLNDCIDSGFVSSVGEYVTKFEIELANYTGAKRAVVIVNGTEALHLALVVLSIGLGDEVITQPLTFIATVNAITYSGATPVFVDVDKTTMGMSPSSLHKFLIDNSEMKNGKCYNKTTGRQIKACIPMHTFGHPSRIDEIAEICNIYKIALIEDAAESIGSKYKGISTGRFGVMGTLSFNGNKIITSGGGGAILTDNEELADKAKHLSTQAKIPHTWEYNHDHIGFNFRMPNINAALGLAQLENIDNFISDKRKLALIYKTFFEEKGIEFFEEPTDAFSNYWLNAIILKDRNERDSFLKYTNENGIMTRPIWNLINKTTMFASNQCTSLLNAEWLEDKVVNIPSSVI